MEDVVLVPLPYENFIEPGKPLRMVMLLPLSTVNPSTAEIIMIKD